MTTHTISEVTAMYQLTPATLRYYEALGLLYDVEKQHNHRIYRDCHLQRLSTICCFKNSGMSLKELQTLFQYQSNDDNLDRVLILLHDHQRKVDTQLSELQKAQAQIERKIAYYTALNNAKQANLPLPDWQDYKA
jgi:DNA-binding transcriptional MerR regulator